MMKFAQLATALAISSAPLGAQESATDLPETPNTKLFARIERAVIKIHRIFGAPLHPIIGGVAPGSGWGAGLGYTAPVPRPWHAAAKAVYTTNRYYVAEAYTGYEGRRGELEIFGRARDMTRLDYYGPSTNSNLFNRTNFRLKDPVVGGHGKFRVLPWVAVGGRVEELWPDLGPGRGGGVPSLEQRYTDVTAPGLAAQPRFGRYQASVDVHLPASAGDGFFQGTRSRVTYAIYDDQELSRYDFKRVEVEAKQTFASFIAHHRLTLSGWASSSTTSAGQDVPFYLQQTLGGKSDIRSVHEDRLGSDGTDATLRGYRNLRFRDRNLLLLQAEYRVPLWGPIDATLFADAGKVTSQRSELDLTDLRRDFGFSLSVMKGWATAARIDVGFGSGEGTRVFLSLGELTP